MWLIASLTQERLSSCLMQSLLCDQPRHYAFSSPLTVEFLPVDWSSSSHVFKSLMLTQLSPALFKLKKSQRYGEPLEIFHRQHLYFHSHLFYFIFIFFASPLASFLRLFRSKTQKVYCVIFAAKRVPLSYSVGVNWIINNVFKIRSLD